MTTVAARHARASVAPAVINAASFAPSSILFAMARMVACVAMTPQALRKLADEQEARGHACRDAGDVEGAIAAYSQAEVNRRVADGLEARAKTVDSRSTDVHHDAMMGLSENERRGRAVARAAAHNALLEAITDDPRWGSGTKYARKRLKIAPSSLTGYMDGSVPCPRHVDKKVREDFPGLAWTWKKGVVD